MRVDRETDRQSTDTLIAILSTPKRSEITSNNSITISQLKIRFFLAILFYTIRFYFFPLFIVFDAVRYMKLALLSASERT